MLTKLFRALTITSILLLALALKALTQADPDDPDPHPPPLHKTYSRLAAMLRTRTIVFPHMYWNIVENRWGQTVSVTYHAKKVSRANGRYPRYKPRLPAIVEGRVWECEMGVRERRREERREERRL